MDTIAQINTLISLAEEMGIEVRQAALGGDGGGLCTIRGERVLFVDTTADARTRLFEFIEENDRLRFFPNPAQDAALPAGVANIAWRSTQ